MTLALRRRTLLAVVLACLLCTGAGAGAATLLKSPAQAAAETVAPPPDVLTAPVVRKVLAQSVVTRGKVTASQHVEITATGTPAGVGRAVVTKVKAEPGATLKAGQVLLEVSGRPVVLLQGAMPAYRDLMRGTSGEDVTQLRKALAGIGYPSHGDAPGEFGAATEQAVTRFYRARGYAPPTSSGNGNGTGNGTADKNTGAGTGTAGGGRLPMVPLSEVAYVDSPTARADTVTAQVGDDANGALLSVTSGALVVNGSVASYEKGLIRPGQSVEILYEATGASASGTVASVSDRPAKARDGESERSGEAYALRVKSAKALPEEFNGADVRLTVVAASSRDEVLAVPASAVSAGADGLTSVTVRSGGRERRVAVRVGMTGDGFVQITPQEPAAVAEGDQVVVGVQTRGRS
ncbi:peptidoglycan-binding protein [Streptomyces sp. NPDC047803]|uniref:peptidoglycan-binding protein n=1 Tax=Streptomyces sp. NPDC047803 TaxID=3160976 RepID=UPI0033E53B5F